MQYVRTTHPLGGFALLIISIIGSIFILAIVGFIPDAFAIKRTYPSDGYCTKYTTPTSQGGFGYDRIEVPNPLMSDYLEGLSANDAVAEMNRIKADHLCMQRADIEYILTKTTDETRRIQLQKELEDIIKLENDVKNKLKLMREREERIAKLLETLRALAKYSNEIGIKNMIDLRSIILDEFHQEWENSNQELETQATKRAVEVKTVMQQYMQSDPLEQQKIKTELIAKVRQEYTVFKQRIEDNKQQIRANFINTLHNQLNTEQSKFDIAVRKEIIDTDELSKTLQAYQAFRKEEEEEYTRLIDDIINASLTEIDQLSRNIEKVIGSVELPSQSQLHNQLHSKVHPKILLASLGIETQNIVRETVSEALTPVKAKVKDPKEFEEIKNALQELNTLLHSAYIQLLKIMQDSQITKTVADAIKEDNSGSTELITILNDFDAKEEEKINKSYRRERRTIVLIQKRQQMATANSSSTGTAITAPVTPPLCAPLGLPNSPLALEFEELALEAGIIDCQTNTVDYGLDRNIYRGEAAKILFTLKLFSLYPDLSKTEREEIKKTKNINRVSKNYDATEYTNEYKDVEKEAWYADYIATLTDWGIISGGDGSTTFRPKEHLNNAEGIKMIMASYLSGGKYEDKATIQEWGDMKPGEKATFAKKYLPRIAKIRQSFAGYKSAWYTPYFMEADQRNLGGPNQIYFYNNQTQKGITATTTKGDFLLWAMRIYTSGFNTLEDKEKRLLNEDKNKTFILKQDSIDFDNRRFPMALGDFIHGFDFRYTVPKNKHPTFQKNPNHFFAGKEMKLEYYERKNRKKNKDKYDLAKIKQLLKDYNIKSRRGRAIDGKNFRDFWEDYKARGNCTGFSIITTRLFNGFAPLSYYVSNIQTSQKTLFDLNETDYLENNLITKKSSLQQKINFIDWVGIEWIRQQAQSPFRFREEMTVKDLISRFETFLKRHNKTEAKDGFHYLPYLLSFYGGTIEIQPLKEEKYTFEGDLEIDITAKVKKIKNGKIAELKEVNGELKNNGKKIIFNNLDNVKWTLDNPANLQAGNPIAITASKVQAEIMSKGTIKGQDKIKKIYELTCNKCTFHNEITGKITINSKHTINKISLNNTKKSSLKLIFLMTKNQKKPYHDTYGHSVIPYSFHYDPQNKDLVWLGIYDNNKPGNENLYFRLNQKTNEWDYVKETKSGKFEKYYKDYKFFAQKKIKLIDAEFASHAVYNAPEKILEKE